MARLSRETMSYRTSTSGNAEPMVAAKMATRACGENSVGVSDLYVLKRPLPSSAPANACVIVSMNCKCAAIRLWNQAAFPMELTNNMFTDGFPQSLDDRN